MMKKLKCTIQRAVASILYIPVQIPSKRQHKSDCEISLTMKGSVYKVEIFKMDPEHNWKPVKKRYK